MERLTYRAELGVSIDKNEDCPTCSICWNCDIPPRKCMYISDALEKLANYEDLEEQGRLIKLPCKVGNTVYRYVEEKGCVLEYTVWNISMSAYESGGIDIVIEGCAESEDEVEDEFSLSLIDFKNEFFNTREEAEAEQKLKEMNTDNGIAE